LPRFSETGYLSGVNATDWSWSPLFADFDNDGFKDLHVTNGFVRDLTNGDFVLYRMQQYGNKLVSDRDYVKTLADGLAAYPGGQRSKLPLPQQRRPHVPERHPRVGRCRIQLLQRGVLR
jgi:hypothetical protein